MPPDDMQAPMARKLRVVQGKWGENQAMWVAGVSDDSCWRRCNGGESLNPTLLTTVRMVSVD